MPPGDPTAASRWVEEYADSLLNYAIVRVNDREVARDLVQETFLSALQNLPSFRGESTEKTWLFAIMKNKIVDHYRKRGAGKISPPPESEELLAVDDYFGSDGEWKESARPLDWGGSPENDYSSGEFNDVLQKCLAKLKNQWRAIFTLKYLDELESEEICKELGISPSNYWVIMHRTKLALRRCVEKNWLDA